MSAAEKPRYRVKARRLGVVPLTQGAHPTVMQAYDDFRAHMEREGAMAVGLVAVSARGAVMTQFNSQGQIHALAGGTMNLLYRIQHEGMDW